MFGMGSSGEDCLGDRPNRWDFETYGRVILAVRQAEVRRKDRRPGGLAARGWKIEAAKLGHRSPHNCR